MEVLERTAEYFKEADGTEPLKDWLEGLHRKNMHVEHNKIVTRIRQAAMGNFGDHKRQGSWGYLRIDFGPGYRIYFGLVGSELILLLHGATKKRQSKDIELAKDRWKRYLHNQKENTDGK